MRRTVPRVVRARLAAGGIAVLIAVIGSALSSCAPHVAVSTPRVSLPARYASPSGAGSVPLDRWWTVFNDAQLDALEKQALDSSPDARLIVQRILEAAAVRDQAVRATGPTGNLQASAQRQYTQQISTNTNVDLASLLGGGSSGASSGLGSLASLFNPVGAVDSYSVGLNASWELDLFGRLAATRRQAHAQYVASVMDAEASRTSLAASIASALFQARGNAAALDDARATARISETLATSAKMGVERGLTPGQDAAKLESDAAFSRSEVNRLMLALRTSRRELLVLLGRGADPIDSLAITADLQNPPRVPADAPGLLLTRRPDVREAEAKFASALAGVKIDRLALFPRISLQPGGTYSATNSPLGGTTLVGTLAGGLALPVLDRPKLLAQLRVGGAQAEEAAIQYEQTVQQAYRDADNALATVASDSGRLDMLAASESSARFAFVAAQTGYRIGLTDSTSLLQAEQNWRAARSRLTALRAAALTDVVTAFKALGGGWNSEAAPKLPPSAQRID